MVSSLIYNDNMKIILRWQNTGFIMLKFWMLVYKIYNCTRCMLNGVKYSLHVKENRL